MLAEILRRLPSLTSLARAAFACPRLRDVASSSSVANRFISPAPLLGYFISVQGGDIPSFHRALLRSDRDVAGIVRCGDFQLTDFEGYKWRLMDCRYGLLLLTSDRCMAVFDPVSGSRLRIPHCVNMSNGAGGKSSYHCFLPASGDATSFRVLCLERTGGGRVRPRVYRSSTGEWCSHSLSPKGITPPRRGDQHTFNHYFPMHAGGRIYWRTYAEKLASLDVGSMEFSNVPLPHKLYGSSSYAVGDAEDGRTCIVAVSTTKNSCDLDMRVWFLKGEGGLSWEKPWKVDASHLLDYRISVAKVCDVTAGVVLLSTGYKNKCLRYIAFTLKDILWDGTTKLADFFTSEGWVHPYFMAWPRPTLKVPSCMHLFKISLLYNSSHILLANHISFPLLNYLITCFLTGHAALFSSNTPFFTSWCTI
jgi:hypothetical protein